MKWQDFYFGWLEKIGYYDWYNATLVEYKTPYPVGSRSNIGTVGFGGEGQPSIQGVPNTPTVYHPAQNLIDNALSDTSPIIMQGSNLQAQLNRLVVLTESEKNTLRYWGFQPKGKTMVAESNFYRGFAYYSNAMKQKKELRGGRRGSDVLIKGTKKQWLTDKKHRTYPSLKMNQKAPMLAIRHPDYSHYGDIGNIMELSWGRMNGLSYTTYDSANQDQKNNLEESVAATKLEIETKLNLPTDFEAQKTVLRNNNYRRNSNLHLFQEITGQEDTEVKHRDLSEEEKRVMDEVNNFVAEKYSENKGVLARSKRFREINYVSDRVAYETRNEVTSILLGVDRNMSVTTAEVILQILANPTYGFSGAESMTAGLVQNIIDREMDRLIPRPIQIRLKELLIMGGRNEEGRTSFPSPTQNNHQPTPIGSYFLNFPMNKMMFSTGNSPLGADNLQWSFNGSSYNYSTQSQKLNALTSTNGYEIFFVNQWGNGSIGCATEILDFWDTYQIVDSTLSPLVTDLLELFRGDLLTTQYDISFYGNISWLYSLPSWTNPNYAMAIATSATAKSQTFDWQPKDIGFSIDGVDLYLYDIKLESWAQHYKVWEPKPEDERYWEISMMFNQPVNKKSRGITEPVWEETHQIILDLKNGKLRAGQTVDRNAPYIKTPLIDNNIGMLSCSATIDVLSGTITETDYPTIIYEFWDDTVSWPYDPNIPIPNVTGLSMDEKGLGNLHSYLTPMDNDSEWWDLFLDADTGILSMNPPEISSSSTEASFGWDIGWDFGYMDSIIQEAKLRGRPWAENLTLNDYTKKVYPSDIVTAKFHPKMKPKEGGEDNESYAYNQYYLGNNESISMSGNRRRRAQVGDSPRMADIDLTTITGNIPWNNPDFRNITQSMPQFTTFLPIDYSMSYNSPLRIKRRNNYGGVIHTDAELAALKTRAMHPTMGYEPPTRYLEYVSNNDGYEVIGEMNQKSFNATLPFSSNHKLHLNQLRGGAAGTIVDAGGILPVVLQTDNSGFMVMEQDNGNLVAIPKYDPVIMSWMPSEWDEMTTTTGYSNRTDGITGNSVSMSMMARGDAYEPTFNNAPKVFLSNLPPDSLEIEAMPESLVGRPIEYTMNLGTPWRRGKIFIINWAALLSNRVLGILMPTED